ncbi:MAG: GNAT family N-acetyltransferase, partial [Clostridia bacterium]|nr:GNAT family N-acetyltransferase [Clostridia bacterium]
MPIPGIEQPELISISDTLRLRKYDGIFAFALDWYLDTGLVYLVDGVRQPYTMEKLQRMYTYLHQQGELYWIEVFSNDHWRPVG